jgi:hypothetical protein
MDKFKCLMCGMALRKHLENLNSVSLAAHLSLHWILPTSELHGNR